MSRQAASERRSRAERTARTRDKLFKATLELIADRGLAALTTRGVARAAGVTVGAIYAHFESRDAMVSAALDWYHAHVPDLYVPEARSVRELLCGRMDQLLSAWTESEDEALAAIYAMQRELLASSEPAVRQVAERWQNARKTAFAARIEEVAEQAGERLAVDPAVLAEQAIYLGVAFQELPPGLVPRYVAQAAVEALAERAVRPG
jgi:AcrR family transcriptional regulator